MLNKITIDNFKSLKHLEYNCAGLNLLTGMNGAGKSSFIQMLRLLHSLKHIKHARLDRDAVSEIFGKGFEAKDIRYSYLSEYDFLFKNAAKVRVEFMSQDMRQDFVNLSISALEDDRIYFTTDTDVEIKQIIPKLANLFYVDAYRIPPTSMHDRCIDCHLEMIISSGHFDFLKLSPFGASVAEFLGEYSDYIDGVYAHVEMDHDGYPSEGIDPIPDSEYADRMNDLESRNLLNRINNLLDVVSPGSKLVVRKQSVCGEVKYFERIQYGEKEFSPENVGFGVSYILPVLLAMLLTKKGDLLIIENPEAHLHPRGQAEMGKLIAETVARGVQVFVETHSDHAINGIRVAVKKGIVKPEDVNIAFFERGPHNVLQEDGTTQREIYSDVTNIKMDANGSLSEWPKDFMDEWGIQQMKLLRP